MVFRLLPANHTYTQLTGAPADLLMEWLEGAFLSPVSLLLFNDLINL